MLNSFGVSIVLLLLWGISYFINKKWLYTAKIYYLLLFVMASAGVLLDLDSRILYYTQSYSFSTILLFAILMLIILIPWKRYDNWMTNYILEVNGKYIQVIKPILLILILLSVFTIIYCSPYALNAMMLGALDIRTSDSAGLLPPTIATTLASAVAGLAPFGLLLFFICRLDKRISSFSLWLLLLPLASVIHSMACAARELYIYLPLTFLILYMFFTKSLSTRDNKKIKRLLFIILSILGFFFLSISISRFGEVGSDSFVSGTWGYLYQQPYVFDQTLRYFDNFYAFDRRLPFLGTIFNVGDGSFEVYDSVEWSFGTMYNEFYQMFGYTSLFIGAFLYVAIFYFFCKLSIRKKSAMAIAINLTIFIWFTISGIFYFRYGDTSYFLLYLFIACVSLWCPSILNYRKLS